VHVDGHLTVVQFCGALINLSFDTAVPIPPNDYTTVVVDIPKSITVLDERSMPYPVGSTPPPPKQYDVALRRPESATVTVKLRIGNAEVSKAPA